MTYQRPRKILILGDFSLSRGEAGSNYVLGLGNALRDAGFEVEYLSGCPSSEGIRQDFQSYVCHIAPDDALRGGLKRVWSRVRASGNMLIECLEQFNADEFHAIIVYPESTNTVGFLLRLKNLCIKKTWKLVVVVTEWYGFNRAGSLPNRLLAILDTEMQLRIVNKKINRILVVSTYLERYYKNAGCEVLRVPPLIDARAAKWVGQTTKNDHKSDLKLLFSGSWFRERLDLIMEATSSLRRDGNRVVLEFLGSELNDLEKFPKLQKKIMQSPPGTFLFHGRLPVEKVIPIIAAAHYGVLFRDRAKWSDACFPSKVAEFQALGVPLLCNLTSDLEEQFRDGDNALVVPQVTLPAFVTTLKRALALLPLPKERLRQGSLKCAATYFDYRTYVVRLGEFFDKI